MEIEFAGLHYALFRLGVCFEKGRGVHKSIKEANFYYKSAADKGSDGAKRYLERLSREVRLLEK